MLDCTIGVNDEAVISTINRNCCYLILVIISLNRKSIPVKLVALITNYTSALAKTVLTIRSLVRCSLIFCIEVELISITSIVLNGLRTSLHGTIIGSTEVVHSIVD